MKVLIDTNILVSAILRDRLPERIILYVAEHPHITWIVSDDILAEYHGVLQRPKFRLAPHLLQRWFALIDNLVVKVAVDIVVEFGRDPKDAKFLACSLVSEADFFITGDRDFEDVQKLGNTKILSAFSFQRLVMESKLPPV